MMMQAMSSLRSRKAALISVILAASAARTRSISAASTGKRSQGEAREGLDELGHFDGVDVGVGRIGEGRALEPGEEARIAHAGMIEPERQGREAREHVEEPAAAARVAQMTSLALLEIEHQVV